MHPSERLEPLAGDDPLDLPAVERLLRRALADPPAGRLRALRFRGGSSNLTYLLSDGSRQWVLRRPPAGPLLPTAHDMVREYRVLSALARTDVPVPRPLALCRDEDVIGAPFYVMERRRGVVLREQLPPEVGRDPATLGAIGHALVETLARLHAVDWRNAGLGEGFGKPGGYVARQLGRWAAQWERTRTAPLPALDRLERWLEAHLPPERSPAIVHGDYRLENCLFALDPVRVTAVLDWEMATLGDPLADVGWMLAYWPHPDDPPEWREAVPPLTLEPGFPRREELVDLYARLTGRPVGALRFYLALAFYKLAIIAAGIARRIRQGQIRLATDADQVDARARRIAAAGLRVVEGRSS